MDTKSQEWIEATQARIREVFDLFDKDKSDSIVQEEVLNVMRGLGVFPTDKAFYDMLPQIQDDEPTGFISYDKFEMKMLQLMASKEWDPDSGDLLLQAFRTIDTNNTGYIKKDILAQLLKEKGTPFRETELDTFLKFATDPTTDNIYYEDYISKMAKLKFL